MKCLEEKIYAHLQELTERQQSIYYPIRTSTTYLRLSSTKECLTDEEVALMHYQDSFNNVVNELHELRFTISQTHIHVEEQEKFICKIDKYYHKGIDLLDSIEKQIGQINWER